MPNSGIRELVTSANLLAGSLGQVSYDRIEEILHLRVADRVHTPNHRLSPIIASPAKRGSTQRIRRFLYPYVRG
jgi:hypothetical protein